MIAIIFYILGPSSKLIYYYMIYDIMHGIAGGSTAAHVPVSRRERHN